MTIVPRTGPLSASSALATTSWYQRGKSVAWGVRTGAFAMGADPTERLPEAQFRGGSSALRGLTAGGLADERHPGLAVVGVGALVVQQRSSVGVGLLASPCGVDPGNRGLHAVLHDVLGPLHQLADHLVLG